MTYRIPARLGPSIAHWLAGVFVMCALVLTPCGHAEAAPGDPPTMDLNPAEGPPGSQVTATIAGFDACKPDEGAETGLVRLLWDGVDEVGSAPIDSGAASIEFPVPNQVTLDRHELLAVCSSNPKLTAARPFDVVAPTVRLTPVPDVTTLHVGEASDRLGESGLVLGDVSGRGDVVEKQDPAAGARVTPGSPVDVDLVRAAPGLVRVPDVVGMSGKDAPRVVTDRGLVLGATTDDGTVVGQEPASGTLVPVGSMVSLRVKADRGLPVLPLVLAGIVVAAVLAGGYRVIRTRRSNTWTRNHVSVAPDDLTEVGSAMAPAGDGPSDEVVVRIDSHMDAGTHQLEELPR